jgi:fatty acid-binding protein DegV
MSFCLVADVSCDVPQKYLSHPQLRLLPVHIFIEQEKLLDTRHQASTERFYLNNLASPDAVEGRSEPLKSEEMLTAFNDHLALNFDQVLGVFVASSRSSIYVRAKHAMAAARIQAYAARAKAGIFTSLQADCLDSRALFAGYAAQVLDLLDLVESGASLMDIIVRQQKTAAMTYTYMVPGDVSYILRRATFKGEKSVSALAAFAAKTFSITPILQAHLGQTAAVGRKLGKIKAREAIVQMAIRSLEKNILVSEHICLSYSGDLGEISKMPLYEELLKKAQSYKVEVHLANMSMTGSVNVGPNALSLGFLAQKHEVEQLL